MRTLYSRQQQANAAAASALHAIINGKPTKLVTGQVSIDSSGTIIVTGGIAVTIDDTTAFVLQSAGQIQRIYTDWLPIGGSDQPAAASTINALTVEDGASNILLAIMLDRPIGLVGGGAPAGTFGGAAKIFLQYQNLAAAIADSTVVTIAQSPAV